MEKISNNITYAESIYSETAIRKGISNKPNKEQIKAMKEVAKYIFQPVREHFCVKIYISSFFRSKLLNLAIGGSETSSHMRAEAIDVDADVYGGVTNAEIFNYILENLSFDQLIWEHGTDEEPNWVHFSFVSISENRNEALKCFRKNGETQYKIITKN
jgi:zinc D-Ala-D-Ala carboxypeptidase